MEGFGRGLCRAAAIEEGGVLDLEGKLERGSQTALAAVIQIAVGASLTEVRRCLVCPFSLH